VETEFALEGDVVGNSEVISTTLQDIPSQELTSQNVRKYIMLDQLLF